MRHIIFDTQENVENLLPISFTRPVSHIRVGILTILEKWEKLFGERCCVKPVEFLADVFPCEVEDSEECIYVASDILPEPNVSIEIEALGSGEALYTDSGDIIAFRAGWSDFEGGRLKEAKRLEDIGVIRFVFDIFLLNRRALMSDYRLLTADRESLPLSTSNIVIGDFTDDTGLPMVFLEEGATVEGAVINVKEGPVYVGRNAEIMEGSCLRGAVALCENARVRMGAKIYGATTLGPYCKAGGELHNVMMLGYSNKAHDGYLGNAVIGEWCNIGAGVNASNLKNDYSKIRIWNYPRRTFMRTDLQFCGLIMGDHSKAGVNCMFNTATVLGVGVNVHGAGFPRVFIPSFSEGSAAGGFSDVSLKKFFEIAERVMGRRGKTIGDSERKVFEHVYSVSQNHK